MSTSIILLLLTLLLQVQGKLYANTTSDNGTVSTFNPSAASSAKQASMLVTAFPTSTSSSASSAVVNATALPFAGNVSFPWTNSSLVNATTTSLPYLETWVEEDIYGTTTITMCPRLHKLYHEYMQNPANSTCCDYYNASGNVAAFDDWMTAGDGVTSPYVGAQFGCCGDCVVRANNIQVYYWTGAAGLAECSTIITTSSTDSWVIPSTVASWTYTDFSWVDPAFGCNGSAPTPVTAVIDNNTLTSPTPWIGFTSIGAYDHCGSWWEKSSYMTPITTPLSTFVSSTTTTFPPDTIWGTPAITTVINVYSAINYADYDACVNSDTDCNPILKGGNYGVASGHGKACYGPVVGYHDPPIALSKAQSLDNGVPSYLPVISGASPPPKSSRPRPDPDPPAPQNNSPPGRDPAQNPSQNPPNAQNTPNQQPAQPGQSAPANQVPTVPTPPASHKLPTLTIGSSIYTPNAQSTYNIDGQPLIPGGPAILHSGTPISIAPYATALVIGTSTQLLPPPHAASRTAPITIAPNLILSPNPNPTAPPGYIIGAQTLIPGGPAAIIAGTAVALDISGNSLIIDGTSTRNINPTASALIIGSETLSRNPTGAYVLDGKTLVPGAAAITVDGTVVSLDPAGTAVVVDGTQTIDLGSFIDQGPPVAITLGAHPVTANPDGRFVIGSQTLRPGGSAVTVDGTVYELPPSGAAPVAVLTLPPGGLGALIMQGFDFGHSSTHNHGSTGHTLSTTMTNDKPPPSHTKDTGGGGKGKYGNENGNELDDTASRKKSEGNRLGKRTSALFWEASLLGIGFLGLFWI